MKLKEWMDGGGYKPPSLVSAINAKYGTTFSKTSIYRIAEGSNPSLELAVAIDMFTGGKVKPIDMLSNSVLVGRVLIDGEVVDDASVVWDPQGIGAEREEDFSDLLDEL